MRSLVFIVVLIPILAPLAGCSEPSPDRPPSVRLGDTVCDQCNMIISDERWATATIVEGPRGPAPLRFDDFNCQVNYEIAHPDLQVVARWSHNQSGEWMRTEQAHFLLSPALRTPMGSKIAAFGSKSDAMDAMSELTGDVMNFDAAWKRLGFVTPGRQLDGAEANSAKKEQKNAS